MTEFNFADRYAEAGLSPTAEIVAMRQATVERIVSEIKGGQLLDLVGAYYGSPNLDLSWFRDQFAKDDAGFSLVRNDRECKVLSAIILGSLVAAGNDEAVLAVIAGNVVGQRTPTEAIWLITNALATLNDLAVSERRPPTVDIKVTPTVQLKLADEIGAIGANDWPTLLATMIKIRNEAQASTKTIAAQSVNIMNALQHQIRLQREEGQMLWWIFGGHSRALVRSFASLTPAQAAIVAAIDLATLTTVSKLGPVAAPAMLERVINLAKRPTEQTSYRLDETIDGLAREDLQRLEIKPDAVPARIAPMITAIALARTIGPGAWHIHFNEITGVQASVEFKPLDLGEQIYREHLLGQLI